MQWLLTHWHDLVAIIGSVVMLSRIIVKLTPTPEDDTALEKMVQLLKHLGLHVDSTPKS